MSAPAQSGQQTAAGMYVPAYWPMYVYGQSHSGAFYSAPQLAQYVTYAPSMYVPGYSVPAPESLVSAESESESEAASDSPVATARKTPRPRVRYGFTKDKSRWVLARPKTELFAAGGDFRVLGLGNPSFICYMNSILQVLLPFTGFSFEYFAQHGDSGLWHRLFRSLFQHFSALPALSDRNRAVSVAAGTRKTKSPSVLEICGDLGEALARDVGPVGEQHDVGEALMLLLERLHGERCWSRGQDSAIYRIFRGVVVVTEQLRSGERRATEEMFLTLALAPTGRRHSLVDLLKTNFSQGGRKIKILPPVLCVELSRHHIENKETASQAVVSFPETLDVPLSCLTSVTANTKYELYGVVVRSGLYSNSGHYWAAQRSAHARRDWHWINDEVITKISSFDQIANEAATNWCLLLYAQPDARVSFAPSSS